MSRPLPSGAILAGGRSRRMGGQVKALQDLSGKPMLQHVIDKARPQVSELTLVVEHYDPVYEAFGLPIIEDPIPGSLGPLPGVLSALNQIPADQSWLLLLPCDAPFLPPNLAQELQLRAEASGMPLALVRYQGELQPTFSLWHSELRSQVDSAVREEGYAGLKQFIKTIHSAAVDWPVSDVNPFFNINDPQALQRAERCLSS